MQGQAAHRDAGVPKPDEVPDTPPAEIDSKTAAGGTGGRLANGE